MFLELAGPPLKITLTIIFNINLGQRPILKSAAFIEVLMHHTESAL